MPTLDERLRTAIKVAPSAPLELMWLMHFVEARHTHEGPFASLEALRQQFGPQLTQLRSDSMPQYATELVVLAHRSSTLLDLDLTRFFDRIEGAIAEGGAIPSLRSESPEELDVVRARLDRLRGDGGFRSRYIGLLQKLWSAADGEWREHGKAAVLAESKRWVRALDEGGTFRQVLGLPRLWAGRPQLDEVADAALARGSLVLNPCWFGGKIHVIELDGVVHLGRGIRHFEPSYKHVAAEISANIKALADPTRLAILLRLAREPASVTEIARQFQLSQPTVSAHVQVLREAGLLDEKTIGRSAQLSANEEGLRRLFSNAQESLLSLFRG